MHPLLHDSWNSNPELERTVVDSHGTLVEIVILKGLPGGLTESAAEAVSTRISEPGLQQIESAPVYFLLAINSSVLLNGYSAWREARAFSILRAPQRSRNDSSQGFRMRI